MKKYKLYSPIEGDIKDITNVSDPVFAEKMVGDGIAIIPKAKVICSPCDGVINHIFKTNHALTIMNDGVEVLMHLGIDTVELEGAGFKRLITGEKIAVKKGQPLIEMDLDYIKSQNKETDIILLVTDDEKVYKIKKLIQNNVTYDDLVMTYKVKK
ncbi:MAG: PTS glucose transporter subunit IIA [Candidatus Izemoplasmatales bacterium]